MTIKTIQVKGIIITHNPFVYFSEDMEDFPALSYNDWSYEGVTSFINSYEKISTGKETSPNPTIWVEVYKSVVVQLMIVVIVLVLRVIQILHILR